MFPNRRVTGLLSSQREQGWPICISNGYPLLNTYYMPGTMPCICHILFNNSYNKSMAGTTIIMAGTRIYYYFADEETEAQKLNN